VTKAGDLLIVDFGNHRIRRVDARTGIISTIAGTGEAGYSGDGGPAVIAALSRPENAALDAQGNLIIVDEYNNRIRRVDARTGIISTIAGNGRKGFAGDGGNALDAEFDLPVGIASDAAGNFYIGDTQNNRVRKIDMAAGIVTTAVGSGEYGVSADGTDRLEARFLRIARLAVDRRGNIYIADSPAQKIIVVDAETGRIRTFAGTGLEGYSGDGGPATAAQLSYPEGVAVDPSGDVYWCDVGSHRVRRVTTATGIITTVAGAGEKGVSAADEPAATSHLWSPGRLAFDHDGSLYIADIGNERVLRLDRATGRIRVVAGSGDIGDGGPARDAIFAVPGDVVYHNDRLYVADYGNRRVRLVDLKTGLITTFAGGGTNPSGGARATDVELSLPEGLAVDPRGNVYIADNLASRVWRVDAQTGALRLLAGIGDPGHSGDGGPPEQARLDLPGALAVGSDGSVYIADYGNRCIRVVDANRRTVRTVESDDPHELLDIRVVSLAQASHYLYWLVAGDLAVHRLDLRSRRHMRTPVHLTYSVPRSALTDLAIDGQQLLVVDTLAHRVLRVDPETGASTVFAGNGVQAFSGDGGAPADAALFHPGGVAFGARGDVFIADSKNHRIRRVFRRAVESHP
jgi:sugar lactone lactonase YvrE